MPWKKPLSIGRSATQRSNHASRRALKGFMKRFLISTSAALLFSALLFAAQCLLFFYAPSFYLPSLRQLRLPDFIVVDLTQRLGLLAGIYAAWALALATLNDLGWRLLAKKDLGNLSFGTGFFLAATQTFCLYLLIAWNYPSILGFLPAMATQSIGISLIQIAGLALALWLTAFAIQGPRQFRRALILAGLAMMPALMHLPLFGDSPLELPIATRRDSAKPQWLLLGFDALDGDSGNAALADAAKGLGGRIFTQAFTPLPGTHPAWNSILSGSYPERHGVRFFFDSPLPNQAEARTLPRRMQSDFNGQSLFASDQPETSSFDEADGFSGSISPEIGWKAHLNAALLNHFVFPALWINNAMIERLRGFSVNSPSIFNYDAPRFFNFSFARFAQLPNEAKLMSLHSCHLHSPIRLNRWELASIDNWLWLRPKDFSFWAWSKPGDPLSRTPKAWHNPYFLRRPQTLKLLAELVTAMENKGWFQANRVVFLSDHGERFVEGFEIYGGIHGIDLKDRAQNNVVFGIFDPRWHDLLEITTPVSLVDIAPTLLALSGENSEGYDGAPLFDAEGDFRRPSPRPIRGESMGLIAPESWAGSFPQIPAAELESQLNYRPDGSIGVSAEYYRLIMARKEYADWAQMSDTLAQQESVHRIQGKPNLGLQ